jgi:hypothetical protein
MIKELVKEEIINSHQELTKNGVLAKGKRELGAHLRGEKLTPLQALFAKCYECMCGYIDGRRDCESKSCPNYSRMPYRGKNE